MGTASRLHVPKVSRCVLSTRSVCKRISVSSRGTKVTARDPVRHLQGDWVDPKCLAGSEKHPSGQVLAVFTPWSKATAF